MKKLALMLLSFAVITGCTSEPPKPAATPQAPELLTGRSAFQKLYVSARGWAADTRPYQLQSRPFGDYKGKDGKATIWQAAFASASMRACRPQFWSGVGFAHGHSCG